MRVARRALLPLLLLAALGVLVQWPGAAVLLQRALDVGPAVFVGAAACLLGSHALRAQRLHAEWQSRRTLTRTECLRVALLHSAAVNLMPMRSGELGFPWLLWRRWQVPLLESAGSLLWMRLQDAVVLAWLGALTASALLSDHGAYGPPAAAALAVVATALFLMLVARAPVQWVPVATPAGGLRVRAVITTARQALAAATPVTWAWCLSNWLLKVGTLGGLMAVLLADRPLAGWCAALAGEWSAALPVQAPAGFGTYEAAAALGVQLSGSSTLEQALAAALVTHLFGMGVTLTGALWAGLGPSPARAAAPGAGGLAS